MSAKKKPAPNETPGPLAYGIKAVCAAVHPPIPESTLRHHIASGDVAARRIGRRLYISAADAAKFLGITESELRSRL